MGTWYRYFLIALCLFLTGCASLVKKSPDFNSRIQRVKTIAVMPPDIEVYKITVGGVIELIDEWGETAKSHVEKKLKEYLSEKYSFQLKFIDEGWLKANHKDLWDSYRGLYEAVSSSALLHAYYGPHTFATKVKNFDYTLGKKINDLAQVCEADSLLFLYGIDYEATAGRQALWWWNLTLSAALGVDLLPRNPSLMNLGLVDGQSGDLIWFNISNPEMEYSFVKEDHIGILIRWLTKDLITQK